MLVASATKGIGLNALLDAIVRYLPSPEEEGPYAATDKAGKDVEVAADSGQPLVRVFKTAADPFVGRLTYLRVLSGTLKSQGTVFNATQGRGRAHRPAAATSTARSRSRRPSCGRARSARSRSSA